MKVSIYKLPEGRIDIMVEASTGNGKAPVVLRDVTRNDLRARLEPVIIAQRGRREVVAGAP